MAAEPKGLLMIGTNHRQAPVEFREKIAFQPEEDDAFLRAARAATGREPDYREALACDTARMLLEALRDKSVTDRKSLRDRLQRIEAFEGVTGWVSMTKTGEMQRGSFILKVEGKQIRCHPGVLKGSRRRKKQNQ